MHPDLTFAFLLLTSFLCCWVYGDVTVPQNRFLKEGFVCNMDALRVAGCLSHVTETAAKRYKFQCAAKCSRLGGCVGFFRTVNSSDWCVLHVVPCDQPMANSSTPCEPTTDPQVVYYARQPPFDLCGEGGVWDSANLKCICSGGFVGMWCERYGISCRELAEHGYPTSARKRFYLQPPGYTAPRIIMCSVSRKRVLTYVVLNNNKNLFLNRTWDEYVSGFNNFKDGPKTEDSWLGLELLHYYTATLNISRVRMIVDVRKGNIRYYYTDFRVRGKSENYAAYGLLKNLNINNTDTNQIQVVKPAPKVDGCFTSSVNSFTPFSTPDRPSDVTTTGGSSCGSLTKAGWWFSGCPPDSTCNPMGQFYSSKNELTQPYHVRTPQTDLHDVYRIMRRVRVYLWEKLA